MSEEKKTEGFEEELKAKEAEKAEDQSDAKPEQAYGSAGKGEQAKGRSGCNSEDGPAGRTNGKTEGKAEGKSDGQTQGESDGQTEGKSEGQTEDKSEENADEKDSERYLRLLAEFQNFKKRSAKEKSDIHAYANEKIIGDLLPILDNFERALASNAMDDPEAYAKGMAMIFEQMKTALEKAGLQEIEALGKEFNPNMHNAVVSEESNEHESGHVSKELQKGYTLNGKVVRPTMVAVAK